MYSNTKMERQRLCFLQIDWYKIFELHFKSIKESKLQWLQFQILHRIIPINDYLYKLKKVNCPFCTFCKAEIENLHFSMAISAEHRSKFAALQIRVTSPYE